MPKTFSEHERILIRKKLMKEAEYCLSQYGVRKTTVDELVKRVHIPKGTFYLFFESKEQLFYEVFIQFHDAIQDKLITSLTNTEEQVTPQKLTDLIYDLYKMLDGSFLLDLMNEGEMDLILRKLPPEIMKQHTEKDDFSIERLFAMIPELKPEDSKVFSAALRCVFLSMLHRQEVGEDVFDEAMRVMINGVVMQMFGGDDHDLRSKSAIQLYKKALYRRN